MEVDSCDPAAALKGADEVVKLAYRIQQKLLLFNFHYFCISHNIIY
jgi:hypothetical protein